MTTATPARRTEAQIGENWKNGADCSRCGTSYAECTRRVLTNVSPRACCPACRSRSTHDEQPGRLVPDPPPVTTPPVPTGPEAYRRAAELLASALEPGPVGSDPAEADRMIAAAQGYAALAQAAATALGAAAMPADGRLAQEWRILLLGGSVR